MSEVSDATNSADERAMTRAEAALWRRVPWLVAGVLSLVLGVIGIFLPLLPTTPFVLLAAFCFARGSARCEAWLLGHPRFGPMVVQWRARRAVPLRAKQMAWGMMTVSSVISWLVMPVVPWLPAVCCLAVGIWLYRLPTAR
ncbi:YbaN family protein [Roseateles sp. So40a]|uniref:YbaN family protein n=1 Tax=Roseateles sp. So40a TaxID=3400226 RepID=UPI003A8623B3